MTPIKWLVAAGALLALSGCQYPGVGNGVGGAAAIGSAKDIVVKANLRKAEVAAMEQVMQTGDAGQVDLNMLAQIDNSFTYTPAESSGPKVISVNGGNGLLFMAAKSETGNCIFLKRDFTNSSINFGESTTLPCSAAYASSVTFQPAGL